MKEGQQIRPEWIPNAYKDDASAIIGAENKSKVTAVSLLYSGKKMPLKNRTSKAYKKP